MTTATAMLQPAENPPTAWTSVGRAHLDMGSVKGTFELKRVKESISVFLDVTGLPENAGPFVYSIHDEQIHKDGNCSNTGKMFNPYNANHLECDDLHDNSYCAVGDLSGKHGFINTTCFETNYLDPSLSLNPNDRTYIGNCSIVIFDKNNQTVSCGNINIARYPVQFKLSDLTNSLPLEISFNNTGENQKNESTSNNSTSSIFQAGSDRLKFGAFGLIGAAIAALL